MRGHSLYAAVVDQSSENFAAVGRNIGAQNAFAVWTEPGPPAPGHPVQAPRRISGAFSFRVFRML